MKFVAKKKASIRQSMQKNLVPKVETSGYGLKGFEKITKIKICKTLCNSWQKKASIRQSMQKTYFPRLKPQAMVLQSFEKITKIKICKTLCNSWQKKQAFDNLCKKLSNLEP